MNEVNTFDRLTEILLLQAEKISAQSDGDTDIIKLCDKATALCHLSRAICEVISLQQREK